MKLTATYRFIDKLDLEGANGCWIFLGETSANGYGMFWNGTTKVFAHRFAYTLFTGREIPVGLEVGHICPLGTVRTCCNPKHIELQTRQQNAAQMVKEGRGKKKHPIYRITTQEDYKDILESHAAGESLYSIGKRLNRHPNTIKALINGAKPRNPKPQPVKRDRPVKPAEPIHPIYSSIDIPEAYAFTITQVTAQRDWQVA